MKTAQKMAGQASVPAGPRRQGRLRHRYMIGAVSLVVALVVPQLVFAHARVVRSNPRSQAQLSAAPRQIELWFNELLDEGFNSVDIFAAAQADAKQRPSFKQGDAQVDPKDRTHLFVAIQPLPPGEYVVEWRVLSRDGHSAPGRLSFRVLDSTK